MNELDCVKLIKPFKELKVGTKGCIVVKYTENDFEVEFFDDNDETIDVYTIKEIKNIIKPIFNKYGINDIYLFGSYARGEAKASSDIDIY